MFTSEQKALIDQLKLPYPAVAIKFSLVPPADATAFRGELSFCQFVKHAQDSGEDFYIAKENDNCCGKMVTGMVQKPALAASGQMGYDFGVFRSQAANARLYHTMPTIIPGSVRYVRFCPLSKCSFEPDLLFFTAQPEKAEILMRATSYISGDLWEAKCSSVLSCAWLYVYPYLSGKVNYCITGMHHGLKRRNVYPTGLFLISMPYEKLPEVFTALEEMDWELIAMRKDAESVEKLKQIMQNWETMAPDSILKE